MAAYLSNLFIRYTEEEILQMQQSCAHEERWIVEALVDDRLHPTQEQAKKILSDFSMRHNDRTQQALNADKSYRLGKGGFILAKMGRIAELFHNLVASKTIRS